MSIILKQLSCYFFILILIETLDTRRPTTIINKQKQNYSNRNILVGTKSGDFEQHAIETSKTAIGF